MFFTCPPGVDRSEADHRYIRPVLKKITCFVDPGRISKTIVVCSFLRNFFITFYLTIKEILCEDNRILWIVDINRYNLICTVIECLTV